MALNQEQITRLKTQAEQYGGVDSQQFIDKVNSQYWAGSYDKLKQNIASSIQSGSIQGNIDNANKVLQNNQTSVQQPSQTNTQVVEPQAMEQTQQTQPQQTQPQQPKIDNQQIEPPKVENLQQTKPTNLWSIQWKNIISEAPTFKGADWQTYKTVRFDDGSLGTVRVGEQWVNELVGNTYKDEQRADMRQIVEQWLNNADNIYKQISINWNVPENVKNTKPYASAKARYDIANKYLGYTEEQLYNAYINWEIWWQLEKDLVWNPYLSVAKEKYNKKLVTDGINKEAINSLNIYNKANWKTWEVKWEKTALEILNEKFTNLFTSMGKTDNDMLSFKDYMQNNYPDLVTQSQELNAKNTELKKLADERDARLENIIKENPWISINRANMLASRQNKDINEQIKSMSYEVANLSANIQYLTNLADKEYNYEKEKQARQDQLAQEQRGYAFNLLQNQLAQEQALAQEQRQRQYQLEDRTYQEQQAQKQLQQQYDYTYGDINSTDPRVQDIAIQNAVKSMYEKYPIPGMESQSVKVQKVKNLIAQGMSWTQAIAQVENEIRNSNRYKQYLASEQAKMFPKEKATQDWAKLSDGTLYNQRTWETKSVWSTSTWWATTNSVDLISKWEWFRDKAYQDVGWVWTYWHGFTTRPDGTPVQPGDTISMDESKQRLAQEIDNRQNYMNYIKVPLSESQKSALSSFEFNLWSGIWEKNAMPILNAINSWDFNKAGELMKQYNRAGGKVVQGLQNRRNEEAKLIKDTWVKQYTDAQLWLLSTIENITPSTLKALWEAGLTAEDYGLFKNGGLPPTSSQKSSAKSMVNTINELLNSKNLSDAVWPFDVKTPVLSGKTQWFINKFETLSANLTKDNLWILKWPMSDNDVKFVNRMSWETQLNTDEETFKQNLIKLRDKYQIIADGKPLNQETLNSTKNTWTSTWNTYNLNGNQVNENDLFDSIYNQ